MNSGLVFKEVVRRILIPFERAKGLCLDIEVVKDLQVVRDEADRANQNTRSTRLAKATAPGSELPPRVLRAVLNTTNWQGFAPRCGTKSGMPD